MGEKSILRSFFKPLTRNICTVLVRQWLFLCNLALACTYTFILMTFALFTYFLFVSEVNLAQAQQQRTNMNGFIGSSYSYSSRQRFWLMTKNVMTKITPINIMVIIYDDNRCSGTHTV